MTCLAQNKVVTIGALGTAILDVRAGSPGPPDCDWAIALIGVRPDQLTLNLLTGRVSLISGPAGTYSLQWAFVANGSTGTATVIYDPGCVAAAHDDAVSTYQPGVVIDDVRASDHLCGVGTLAVVGTLPPELQFDLNTGAVTLTPAAALGTYMFTYLLEGTSQATVTVIYTAIPFVPPCVCP